MKKLFQSPLFYTNLLLLASVILLGANTPQVNAKVIGWAKQALAAGPIFGTGNLNFLTSFASSNEIGDSIIYDSGTQVGIDTQSPGAKLEIKRTDATDSMILLRRHQGTPTSFSQGTDGALVINNASVNTLTLKGGNVGIGTTNPQAKLHVSGGNIVTENSVSIGKTTPPVAALDVVGTGLFTGNIGIGTAGPTWKFHLVNADTANNIGAVLVNQQDPDTGAVLSLQANGTNIHSLGQGGVAGVGGGVYTISKSGVAKVQLNSGGDSYFNGGNVSIGNGAMILTPLPSDPSGLTNGMIWMRQ